MTRPRPVRDDPRHPDPGFAELYARLPDETRLQPWLGWARRARQPVLYLGVGTGRLAIPLSDRGIEIVGVDAHPGMLEVLHRRRPGMELIHSLIESLELERRFELVIVPSNILTGLSLLERAAAHLEPGGRLGFELTNPHWLESGASPEVRVLRMSAAEAVAEVDYRLSDGSVVTQEAVIPLVWPEELEGWLGHAGLELVRLQGWPGLDLFGSPSFLALARAGRVRPRKA